MTRSYVWCIFFMKERDVEGAPSTSPWPVGRQTVDCGCKPEPPKPKEQRTSNGHGNEAELGCSACSDLEVAS